MNILLINHYAGSPDLGMEFRPYYMAKEWVKQGNKVLIVGGDFSHLRKNQPKKMWEMRDGIQYSWIKINKYKGNGMGRIISMFLFVSRLYYNYKKYLNGFIPDVVIASSTYPLDIYPARKIACKFNAKLIYEVHDLWPLSPMEIGGYSKYHPFIKIIQQAEDYSYKYCDKVVSLLPNALEHMMQHGLERNKFVYIPNGFDLKEWDSPENLTYSHQEFITNLRKKGCRILAYAGGHAKSNALDYLLDAMKLIKDKQIVCLLIGKGQEKERLQKRVSEECITNTYFLDSVPKKEIPSLLALMDALYIGWEKNPLYRFGISPNKLIDYMMSGKAILHSVCASNDWVKETGCGISVKAEDPQEIAKGIINMFSLTNEELKNKGYKGKIFAEQNLSYYFLAKKFIEIIQ